MNILVVEDDVSFAEYLKGLIKKWGHNVEAYTTGKDAVERVMHSKFDLILLEMFLPDIKGYELIPQFKALCPEAGVIAMTSYNSRELEMEVRKQGIIYYMIKPLETKYLKSLIDHIYEKRIQQFKYTKRKGVIKKWQSQSKL
jgi:DNA-binding NtrC family response regulator